MPKLHQIIAVSKGTKNECNVAITAAYHEVQKPEAFSGIARTYRPKDEEGEQYPPEKQIVQKKAKDILALTATWMTKYWDSEVTKDTANMEAKADVIVDGKTLLTAVPVTTLLFLEKQLGDLATMVRKLPVLSSGEVWKHDAATDCYATEPAQTTKSKKVPRAFVKAPATQQHPAQVDTLQEDIVVGFWDTIKYSGAMPQKTITEILERVSKLQTAVKFAREEANSIEAKNRQVGDAIFKHLLG